ncbi:MAG TPA: hypothetical protein QKA08_04775 [Candidatus Megaira endosymbiont of Nemacystus decipiens]|nr:hypothetical protein [Candidatus Megaera endosymbiont of Nemacystus decipiens]
MKDKKEYCQIDFKEHKNIKILYNREVSFQSGEFYLEYENAATCLLRQFGLNLLADCEVVAIVNEKSGIKRYALHDIKTQENFIDQLQISKLSKQHIFPIQFKLVKLNPNNPLQEKYKFDFKSGLAAATDKFYNLVKECKIEIGSEAFVDLMTVFLKNRSLINSLSFNANKEEFNNLMDQCLEKSIDTIKYHNKIEISFYQNWQVEFSAVGSTAPIITKHTITGGMYDNLATLLLRAIPYDALKISNIAISDNSVNIDELDDIDADLCSNIQTLDEENNEIIPGRHTLDLALDDAVANIISARKESSFNLKNRYSKDLFYLLKGFNYELGIKPLDENNSELMGSGEEESNE